MTREEQKIIDAFKYWIDTNTENCVTTIPEYLCEKVYSMTISALEQQPCEDAISRQDVLSKKIYTETEEGWCGYVVDVEYIKSLPSVTVRQTGEWIETDSDDPCWYMCSECHRRTDDKSDYCPSCGCRMNGS